MRHFSIAFLVLLLVVAPSCNFIKNKGFFGKKAKTLATLLAQQDSIRVADSIRKVQDQILAIENAKLDSVRLEQEANQLASQTSKYNIIVGSFITPEYATGHAAAYRLEGYDPKVIKMEGSNFELVSAESHQSLREAVSRLHQFQDTVEIDAWIYIKK